MIINKNIQDQLISPGSTVAEALRKVNISKKRIGYVVDEKNILIGSLSDGDVRRWLLNSEVLDLSARVLDIVNAPCFSMKIEALPNEIEGYFNERINSIPLIDSHGHLVAIAEPKQNILEISGASISEDSPSFVIAEVGNNHQGDLQLAKKLVDIAVDAEVDCVKFQMRHMEKLYRNCGDANDSTADLGAQYTLDLLAKFQLSDEELFEVFDYCKLKGVIPLCTPWDLDSLSKLEGYGMPAYKVSSADFTNYHLLDALAKTGKPLICSTGMSSEAEIQASVLFLKKRNAQFVLLHCNSTYPTPYKDVNLKYIERLKSISQSIVGYSGHERGWSVPVAAISLGAKIIEKHITTDRSLEGADHKVSLLPEELSQMVRQIREVEASLGSCSPREISQGEMLNREVLAKSLIINCSLSKGEIIQAHMVDIKSPGKGLQPNKLNDLIGKKAIRDFQEGDFFYQSDLDGKFVKKSTYHFNRPYGIPVRFHDYVSLTKDVNLDFVEFHLSYSDMELNLSDYISKTDRHGFAVHAPELFKGDHLLDISSSDNDYWHRSINELSRVVDLARELKKYYPKTEAPVIVVNVGGWNVDGFISKDEKKTKYARVKEGLNKIDLSGVQIAIQTMPPFPWHFGGQSFHNLFLDPYEIKEFCEDSGHKICLDVSHSMMACNFYGYDLYEFVEIVSPFNVHMHIVDAKGDDGEGVQIGEGDVDFAKLSKLLSRVSPAVQFIPEVWQGHKNHGQGFWAALAYLEKVGF